MSLYTFFSRGEAYVLKVFGHFLMKPYFSINKEFSLVSYQLLCIENQIGYVILILFSCCDMSIMASLLNIEIIFTA